MSGREQEGQRRELFGVDTVHCDLCGRAVPAGQLRDIESGSPFADHDHVNQICSDCWERVQAGEIDVKSFLMEEDDRGPERQW